MDRAFVSNKEDKLAMNKKKFTEVERQIKHDSHELHGLPLGKTSTVTNTDVTMAHSWINT